MEKANFPKELSLQALFLYIKKDKQSDKEK